MKVSKKNSKENLKEEINMVSLDCIAILGGGGMCSGKRVQSSFHMQIPSVITFDLMPKW